MTVTLRCFDLRDRPMIKDWMGRTEKRGQEWPDRYVLSDQDWKEFRWRWMERRDIEDESDYEEMGIFAQVLYMRLMTFLSWEYFPRTDHEYDEDDRGGRRLGAPAWYFVERERWREVSRIRITKT